MSGQAAFAYSQNKTNSSQNVWGPQAGALERGYAGLESAIPGAVADTKGLQPDATSAIKSLLSPNGNPFLSGMARSAMLQLGQGFTDLIAPTLKGNAVSAGAFGSPEEGNALGVASRGVTQQMQDLLTNMYGTAYQSDRAGQLGALGQVGAVGNMSLNPYAGLISAAGPATVLGQSTGRAYNWSTSGGGGI
jgi:hypothetical protein